MSHHFDTKLAKEDPSLTVCDFYLFQGAPGTTVMAMTVNPDVVLSASDTLHTEGLYAFRLDLNGDAKTLSSSSGSTNRRLYPEDDYLRRICHEPGRIRKANGLSTMPDHLAL